MCHCLTIPYRYDFLMGRAGRHCHCKASNFFPHAQVLPGAQTIKIPYDLSVLYAFGGPEKIFNMFKWCFKHHLCLKYV